MSANATSSLSVSIKELPAVHVVYIDYQANSERGDFHNEIRKCFQRVQNWVRKLDYDPYTLLNVGVPNVVDGQLSSYGCCVQVPEDVQSGPDGVNIKELPGGRYAVVRVEKDPRIIGDSIGRFYQEGVSKKSALSAPGNTSKCTPTICPTSGFT